MDSETEIYAIQRGKGRQARKTPLQSHIAPVDTGFSDDYGGSQGHLGSTFESKSASDDSSNKDPAVIHEDRRDSKHDHHAVLVPIKKGTELGYFSTMSATLYISQDV